MSYGSLAGDDMKSHILTRVAKDTDLSVSFNAPKDLKEPLRKKVVNDKIVPLNSGELTESDLISTESILIMDKLVEMAKRELKKEGKL